MGLVTTPTFLSCPLRFLFLSFFPFSLRLVRWLLKRRIELVGFRTEMCGPLHLSFLLAFFLVLFLSFFPFLRLVRWLFRCSGAWTIHISFFHGNPSERRTTALCVCVSLPVSKDIHQKKLIEPTNPNAVTLYRSVELKAFLFSEMTECQARVSSKSVKRKCQ